MDEPYHIEWSGEFTETNWDLVWIAGAVLALIVFVVVMVFLSRNRRDDEK